MGFNLNLELSASTQPSNNRVNPLEHRAGFRIIKIYKVNILIYIHLVQLQVVVVLVINIETAGAF